LREITAEEIWKMTGRLKNKVGIITGAGSVGPGWGNGKATSVLSVCGGAKVFSVDISLTAAEETKGIIEKRGNMCHPKTFKFA